MKRRLLVTGCESLSRNLTLLAAGAFLRTKPLCLGYFSSTGYLDLNHSAHPPLRA